MHGTLLSEISDSGMFFADVRVRCVVLPVLKLPQHDVNHPWIGSIGGARDPKDREEKQSGNNDRETPHETEALENRNADTDEQQPRKTHQATVTAKPGNLPEQ